MLQHYSQWECIDLVVLENAVQWVQIGSFPKWGKVHGMVIIVFAPAGIVNDSVLVIW